MILATNSTMTTKNFIHNFPNLTKVFVSEFIFIQFRFKLFLFFSEKFYLEFKPHTMAKKTNHTNRNQNRKDHKHGIKKPKRHPLIETPGVNIKRLRNAYYSKLGQEQKAE